MQCACGVENAFNAKFCKECGSKFQIAPVLAQGETKPCPACQSVLKHDAKFCGKCGHKFLLEPVEVSPVVQPATVAVDIKTVIPPEIVNIPVAMADIPPLMVDISKDNQSIAPPATSVPAVPVVNKKTIILTVLALSVVGGASLAWVSLWELGASKPVPASTDVAKLDVAQKPIITPVPEVQTTPVNAVPTVVSKYAGKIIKDQPKLGQYDLSLLGKSGGFKVFSANEDDEVGMLSYTKVVLVTDQAGKVIDSKDVPEGGKMLVDGKSACVLNQKPYVGIYALSSMDSKLTTPTAVWVLNDSGQLVNQDVKGVKCGVFIEFMPESDVLKAITGYNDLHQVKPAKAQPVISNKPGKLEHKAAIAIAKKPAPQNYESKVIAPTETHQEQQAHTPQQEPAIQDESQKKQNNSLGGLFDKLGESIKKVSTERVCSAAERSMNQCN